MHSERSRQALLDILDNAVLALEFTEGFTKARFVADRRTFYAVTRCLEIIPRQPFAPTRLLCRTATSE